MYLQWGCLGRFFKARLLINTKAAHLSRTPLTPFGDQLAFASRCRPDTISSFADYHRDVCLVVRG
jgi:hypothetical protein